MAEEDWVDSVIPGQQINLVTAEYRPKPKASGGGSVDTTPGYSTSLWTNPADGSVWLIRMDTGEPVKQMSGPRSGGGLDANGDGFVDSGPYAGVPIMNGQMAQPTGKLDPSGRPLYTYNGQLVDSTGAPYSPPQGGANLKDMLTMKVGGDTVFIDPVTHKQVGILRSTGVFQDTSGTGAGGGTGGAAPGGGGTTAYPNNYQVGNTIPQAQTAEQVQAAYAAQQGAGASSALSAYEKAQIELAKQRLRQDAAQAAAQNRVQTLQAKTQAAKELADAISTADPLAHTIALANQGDINNLQNLTGVTNDNLGTVDAMIRAGRTAVSDAAILPAAQLQEYLNELNGGPSAGGGGATGQAAGGGGGGGPRGNGPPWWDAGEGGPSREGGGTRGRTDEGERRSIGGPGYGREWGTGDGFAGASFVMDGVPYQNLMGGNARNAAGFQQGGKTVAGSEDWATSQTQGENQNMPNYRDPRAVPEWWAASHPATTAGPPPVKPGEPGWQTYEQAIANPAKTVNVDGKVMEVGYVDPVAVEQAKKQGVIPFANGTDGWVKAPKQWIAGDPQADGRPNPELTQVRGKDMEVKIQPLKGVTPWWATTTTAQPSGESWPDGTPLPRSVDPAEGADRWGQNMGGQGREWVGPAIQSMMQRFRRPLPRPPMVSMESAPGGVRPWWMNEQDTPQFAYGTFGRSGARLPRPITGTPPPPAGGSGGAGSGGGVGWPSGTPVPRSVDPAGGYQPPSTAAGIRELRENTPVPGLNYFDVSWQNLDPTAKAAYLQSLQARWGVPIASSEHESRRYALEGIDNQAWGY